MPRKLIPKTRNSGRWTEARYWGFIRSGLRRMSVRWGPIQDALVDARRKNESDNKRLKWEFQCSQCKGWFPRKEVEADHIEPAGSLKCLEDLPGFVGRLFCEKDGITVLCKKGCHIDKTRNSRTKDSPSTSEAV